MIRERLGKVAKNRYNIEHLSGRTRQDWTKKKFLLKNKKKHRKIAYTIVYVNYF